MNPGDTIIIAITRKDMGLLIGCCSLALTDLRAFANSQLSEDVSNLRDGLQRAQKEGKWGDRIPISAGDVIIAFDL